MKINPLLFLLTIFFIFAILPVQKSYSGIEGTRFNYNESDTTIASDTVVYFYDLRDRESFIQLTNLGNKNTTVHIQIFNVNQNCNENDFFDTYTINDTHVYNMRNIQTNDSNPSGVVLPEDAYGFVTVFFLTGTDAFVGNMRILDNNGYEYRTNAVGRFLSAQFGDIPLARFYNFNFNKEKGIELADIIGVTLVDDDSNDEVISADIVNVYQKFDVDIYDTNEVPFSCRDVIFACVDQENPLLEALLEQGQASTANFEYGINDAIPHSKAKEPLCPGNNIENGHVILRPESFFADFQRILFYGFVGLNNGNERGSFDSIRGGNFCLDPGFAFRCPEDP
jgi:hypothetical protein